MGASESVVKRIQAMVDLGLTTSEAFQKVLGRSLSAFAEAHGHRASEVSMCLNAYPGRVYAAVRDDLAADLGIPREEIDRLIDGEKAEAA